MLCFISQLFRVIVGSGLGYESIVYQKDPLLKKVFVSLQRF
jgi:hypothetical protein